MKSVLRTRQVQTLLAHILGSYLTLALRTTRWTLDGQEHFPPFGAGAPVVVAFWHEFLPLMPGLSLICHAGYPFIARPAGSYPGQPASRRPLYRRGGAPFRYLPILGSSTRGRRGRFAEPAGGALRQGDLIGITPDGPRGPRRQAAAGVAQLAALSGAPVLPCAARTSRRIRAQHLGPHAVPLPFGRGVVVCGPAVPGARHEWKDAVPVDHRSTESGRRPGGAALCRHDNDPLADRGLGGVRPRCWRRHFAVIAARPGARERPGNRRAAAGTPRHRSHDRGRLARCCGCTPPAWARRCRSCRYWSALRHRVKVLLTTGTVTSQALLDRRIPGQLGLAGDVLHRFAPLDVPAWVGRFLSHWRPDAACFVESELRPNQLAACRARGIPMMLLNARMSDRSFACWRLAPGLARHVLDSFSHIQARGELDAEPCEPWAPLVSKVRVT